MPKTALITGISYVMVDADLEAAGRPAPGEGKRCLAGGHLAWLRSPL